MHFRLRQRSRDTRQRAFPFLTVWVSDRRRRELVPNPLFLSLSLSLSLSCTRAAPRVVHRGPLSRIYTFTDALVTSGGSRRVNPIEIDQPVARSIDRPIRIGSELPRQRFNRSTDLRGTYTLAPDRRRAHCCVAAGLLTGSPELSAQLGATRARPPPSGAATA